MAENVKSNQNLIDTATAAKLLKVTQRRVQQLAKEGWFAAVKRGRWSLVDVVHGYIDFLNSESRSNSQKAADNRVRDARAAKLERELAIQDREIIALDEAVYAVEEVAGVFLSNFSGLPAQITRDPRERKRIEKVIDTTRQRISKRLGEIDTFVRTGRDSSDTVDAE